MNKALVGAMAFVAGLSPMGGLPAAQAETKSGAGAFAGTMAYQGDGIPIDRSPGTIWPDCRKTFFDLSFTAVVSVEHDGRTFRGSVTMVGGGGSGLWPGAFECESLDLGNGLWHLSVPLVSDQFGATFHCAELLGYWMRVGTELISETRGTCEVDGVDTGHLFFVIGATWAPIGAGPGTDSVGNVTDALLTGAMHIDDDGTLG